MITVSVQGLDATIDAVRALPTAVSRSIALEEVGQKFSARLRAATPKGYSGRLKDSVIADYRPEDGVMLVGYEQGVETAGNPKLDSVRTAQTKGRSVLRRWVRPEDLESVLQETFDAYTPDVVETIAESLPDVIS